MVELTLSIFNVFDLNKDKVIWDVGHQAYVHKILTGRKDKFNTLRQYGGLSGFPKRCESLTMYLKQGIVVHLYLLPLEWQEQGI